MAMEDAHAHASNGSAAEMGPRCHPPLHQTPFHHDGSMWSENCRRKRPPICSCPCCGVSPNRRPRNKSRRRATTAAAALPPPYGGGGASWSAESKSKSKSSPHRIRRTPSSSSSSSSSAGYYSRKFFLACSCFYLLSATSSTEISSNGNGERPEKKRFLRSSVAVAAAESPVDRNEAEGPVASSSSSDGNSRGETEVDAMAAAAAAAAAAEPSEEEEFDYETYHARHHIPLPALGASMMMGLMNAGGASAADSSNSPPPLQSSEEEGVGGGIASGGILAFAGTSEAMSHFASGFDDGDDDDDDNATNDDDYRPLSDQAEEDESPPPPSGDGNGNVMMYENTLAQISRYRSLLLWGSDPSDGEVFEEDDSLETLEGKNDFQSQTSNDTVDDDYSKGKSPRSDPSDEPLEEDVSSESDDPSDEPSEEDDSSESDDPSDELSEEDDSSESELHRSAPARQPLNKQTADLTQSDSDLDRGRYLVGLEVREVRPHEQIIVDYASDDAILVGGDSLEDPPMRPIRIKYVLSERSVDVETTGAGDGKDANLEDDSHARLLSTLLDTSFNRTAAIWSRALSLRPVSGGIVPTVATCGGARIPPLHRAAGVHDADVLVYVSADNRFCGGALLHSSVCDYDQRMRPLVANINVCTKNVPTSTIPDNGTQILDAAVREYDAYVATETARILGASASLFRHYQNPDTDAPYGSLEKSVTCVDGTQETISVPNIIGEEIDSSTGTVYYEVRTPKVIEVVRNHFDCMTLTGARLEVKSRGSLSCFGGFLDERLFFGEQVSSFQIASINHEGPTISPLTLALLEDSSWYTANYAISTEMPFGRGAGCQFAHAGGCSVDDNDAVQEAPAESKGFHCSEIGKMGCDASHSFKARCDLFHPTSVASQHAIFAGSSSLSNMCPMHIRGAINCVDEGNKYDSSVLPGEVYGKTSKCFLSDDGVPMCLQAACNEETQTIDVHYKGEVFSCQHDGQIIDTNNGLWIECPRVAAVCPSVICPSDCSGQGVCDEDREGKHTCICDDPFDESPGCWGQ